MKNITCHLLWIALVCFGLWQIGMVSRASAFEFIVGLPTVFPPAHVAHAYTIVYRPTVTCSANTNFSLQHWAQLNMFGEYKCLILTEDLKLRLTQCIFLFGNNYLEVIFAPICNDHFPQFFKIIFFFINFFTLHFSLHEIKMICIICYHCLTNVWGL